MKGLLRVTFSLFFFLLVSLGANSQGFQILNGANVFKCDNDSLILNASTGASYTNYNWYIVGNPTSLGTLDSFLVTVIPSFGQFYAVTADSSGFLLSDTTFVFPLGSPNVNLGIDTFFCLGDTITLKDSALTGPLYSFLWSTGETTETIKVTSGGNYSLKISGPFPNPCASRDTVFVDGRPPLTLQPIPDQIVCSGDPLQINLTFTDAGTPPYDIQWEPAGVFNDPTILNPLASVSSDTTLSVVVEDNGGSGCIDSLKFKAFVFPNISVSSPFSDTVVCVGDTIQLFSNIIGGTPGTAGFTYLWLPNNEIDDNSIPNPMVFPSSQRTYTLDVSDSVGCSDTTQVLVGVNDVQVSILNGTPTFICPGDSVQISTQIQNAGPSPLIQWQPIAGGLISDPNIADPIIFGIGDFTISVTSNMNCIATDSISIQHSPPSDLTLLPPVSTNFCQGDPAIITAQIIGGISPFTFFWYENGTPTDTTTVGAYSVNTLLQPPGLMNISCQAFDATNCPSDFDDIFITILEGPPVSISSPTGPVIVMEPVTFSIAAGTFDSLVWNFGDGNQAVSLVNSIVYTYSAIGQYTAYVRAHAGGCPGIDSLAVEVVAEIKDNLVFIPTAFSPNASSSENQALKVFGTTMSDQNFSFRVFNSWGNLVFETTDLNEALSIGWTGEDYPLGVYIAQCSGEFLDGTKFDISETVNFLK